MVQDPKSASAEIAGVNPFPSTLLNLAYSTGLDVVFMDQVIHVYLDADQSIDLPAPGPGAWVTIQNATAVAAGAFSLTVSASTLWTGLNKVLSNGQWVKYTAMDMNGSWKWAEV